MARQWIRELLPWLSAKRSPDAFPGSREYWLNRYASGGNSGPGSYNHLAEFKAEVINGFVADEALGSVIEFGCGDGNQLAYASYPRYLGVDISPEAVAICRKRFADRPDFTFLLMQDYEGEKAELALSLDVLFHLVEDSVFEAYMHRLFAAAERAVVVFSSNDDQPIDPIAPHVRHRKFTDWVVMNITGWELVRHVPNKYRYDGDFTRTSFADFWIYKPADPVSRRQ